MRKPKTPEKSQKNKTNSQQCISLQITLPQIVPLQNDTKALKIMFPAAQNDEAKKMQEKSQKQKSPCGSAFHCILHFHKLYLYKTRTKHKIYVPSYSK